MEEFEDGLTDIIWLDTDPVTRGDSNSSEDSIKSAQGFDPLMASGGKKRKKDEDSSEGEDEKMKDPNYDPLLERQLEKVRTRTRKTPKFSWEDGQEVAKPFKDGPHEELSFKNIPRYLATDDYDEYFYTKDTRIINPQDRDIYFYKDIDAKDVVDVSRMDGYRFRHKGAKKSGHYTSYKMIAETEVPEICNYKFRKHVLYNESNKKVAIQYFGDNKFGTPHAEVLMDAPTNEWPPEPLCVHPNDIAAGATAERHALYSYMYKGLPQERQVPSLASSVKTAPAPEPKSQVDKAPEDVFTISSAKFSSLRRPGAPKKAKVPTALSSDDDIDDEDKVTATTQSDDVIKYRPARVGLIQTEQQQEERMDLQTIMSYKQYADHAQEEWEKEGRGPFYESVVDTMITDPQPYTMYFRDLTPPTEKLNWDFEEKEADDGYTWRRRNARFIKQEWCDVFKSTYVYYDRETNKLDREWSKNFYVFPKENKMIIHYKGDNKFATHAPHGNSTSNTKPHFRRFPEVKEEALDVLTKNPSMTGMELYNYLSKETDAGMAGVLPVIRNKRQGDYIKQQHKQMIERDLNLCIKYAERETGSIMVRRLETYGEGNHFCTLIDEEMVDAFKEIKRNFKGDERLRFHLDTSFDAAGEKSGFLITHVVVEHPYITRADSGPEEPGVNVPVAALLHQRRTRETHHELLDKVDVMYELGKIPSGTVLVSDREFGENTRVWKDCKKVLCWNHIRDNVAREAKVRFGHARKADEQEISNDTFQLLRCRDEDAYIEERQKFFTEANEGHEVWKNENFQEYFMDNIDSDIRRFAGRWVLEEAGIPNAHRGITNNRAESLNAAYNRLKDKDLVGGMPEALLCYKELVNNSLKEMKRAIYQTGEMRVKSTYRHLEKPPTEMPSISYRNFKEMRQALWEDKYYKEIRDPANPTPVKKKSTSLLEKRLDRINEEIEWYDNPINEDSFRVDPRDFSLRIAAHKQTLKKAHPNDVYTATLNPPTCSCNQGPDCSHYFFLRKRHNLEVPMQEMYTRVKKRLELETKKEKDFGRKQPARDSYIDPLLSTPGRRAASRRLFDASPVRTASLPKVRADTPSPSKRSRPTGTPTLSLGKLSRTRSILKSTTSLTSTSGTSKSVGFVSTPSSTQTFKRFNALEDIGESPALINGDTIDMDTAVTTPHALDAISLGQHEARFIAKTITPGGEPEKVALVKITNARDTIIVGDNDYQEMKDDFKYIAANCNKYKYEYSRQGLHQNVSVRWEPNFKTEADKIANSQSMRLGTKFDTVHLKCYCNHPHVNETHARSVGKDLYANCDCGDGVHETCITEAKKKEIEDTKHFQCACCRVKDITPGVQWSAPKAAPDSEKIGNTCPIDNFLTGVMVYEGLQKPDFLETLPDREENKQLRDTIQLCKEGKFNEAQYKYYKECVDINERFLQRDDIKKKIDQINANKKECEKIEAYNKEVDKHNKKAKEHNEKNPGLPPMVLKKKKDAPTEIVIAKPIPNLRKNNLWGTHDSRVITKHKKGYEFEMTSSCQNPACSNNAPKTNTEADLQVGHLMCTRRDPTTRDINTLSEMKDFVNGGTARVPCGLRGCKEPVVMSDFRVKEDNWAIAFDCTELPNDKLHQAKKDILNKEIPKTIQVKTTTGEERTYSLATITLNEPEYHFTAIHYVPSEDEFVFYDGIDKVARIRKLHQTDLLKEGRLLNTIEYYRMK